MSHAHLLKRALAVMAASAVLLGAPGLPAYAAAGAIVKTAEAESARAAAEVSALPAPAVVETLAPGDVVPAAVIAPAAADAPAAAEPEDAPPETPSPEAEPQKVIAVAQKAADIAREDPARVGQVYDYDAARKDSKDLKDAVASGPQVRHSSALGPIRPAPTADRSTLSIEQKKARFGMRATGVLLDSLSVASLAASGLLWSSLGLPFLAGVATPLVAALAYAGLVGAYDRDFVSKFKRRAADAGGKLVAPADEPELFAELESLTRQAGAPMPAAVYLMPPAWEDLGQVSSSGGEAVLQINKQLLSDPARRVVLAHEVQHLRDARRLWVYAPRFLTASGLSAIYAALALRSADTGTLAAAGALTVAVPILVGAAGVLLLEQRADFGALLRTGESAALKALRGGETIWRQYARDYLPTLHSLLDRVLGGAKLRMAKPAGASGAPEADLSAAYYQSVPAFASKLTTDKSQFSSDADYARYQEQVKRLRPLARWMAHLYAKLKEKSIQRPPNILTIQDILDWATETRKQESRHHYDLVGAAGKDGKEIEGSVVLAAKTMLEKTLPSDKYEDRDLRNEFAVLLNRYKPLLRELGVPARIERVAAKANASARSEKPAVEFSEDEPSLFSAQDVGAFDMPDYVMTATVRERLSDLMNLYSREHSEKFFPLLIGDTAEGKSSLIKFMFAHPQMKKYLGGRAVPVVSIPVKETMTNRELLGGTGPRGIELGFLSLAAQNGWVLVLEELNEANGEFLKLLNDVLFQIRKQGYFEFEVGGKTVRVNAHPDFWIVGTENPEDGNYAHTRNPHSPDFLKRWKVRYYSKFPAAEQAEILQHLSALWYGRNLAEKQNLKKDFFPELLKQLGGLSAAEGGKTLRELAVAWYGEAFLNKREPALDAKYFEKMASEISRLPAAEQAETLRARFERWQGEAFNAAHGLSTDFFEKLVTQFHQPLRDLVASGRLGGDMQEPYEFNRRTMLRFLKRYLYDLRWYEANGRKLDGRTLNLLLARELMEAYGSELRLAPEKDALWDFANTVFELESKWKISRSDVAIEVKGFYRKNGKLVADEKLIPVELPLRENGGAKVPGSEHRMTMVPSLAEHVYQSLRNRQFHEPEFSTGPTGTAKTTKQRFITHMLGEPIFELGLNEQTPLSAFHGGFVSDGSGGWRFAPGIFARAMMHDPEGLLKKGALSAKDVRRSPSIGATLVVNEGNANPNLETANPAIDDGVLNLSDGRHSAVAGAGFHIAVTINPVGEGYLGIPLTGALKSRGQSVEHAGDVPEEELAEILLDRLTGFTRHEIR